MYEWNMTNVLMLGKVLFSSKEERRQVQNHSEQKFVSYVVLMISE